MRLEHADRVEGIGEVGDFNSIKVRLELSIGNLCSHLLEFQFHKGAIRTQRDIASMTIQQNFNSIKVRLELQLLQLLIPWIRHFNSIKVRLERAITETPSLPS